MLQCQKRPHIQRLAFPPHPVYQTRPGLATSRKSLNLDTHYGEGGSVADWIIRASVPLVDKLTGRNFGVYEQVKGVGGRARLRVSASTQGSRRPPQTLPPSQHGLPMLMLFLDLSSAHAPDELGNVGGKSGGLKNNVLLEELRTVAKEHHERISFVYADGIAHAISEISAQFQRFQRIR